METSITIDKLNMNFWTGKLFDLLPLELDQMVLSGQLLSRAYLSAIKNQPLPKSSESVESVESVEILELYVTGTDEKQKNKIVQLQNNLSGYPDKYFLKKCDVGNCFYIIIPNIPVIIVVYQTPYITTADLLASFNFAHECMYCTHEHFYIGSHARLSWLSNQVHPNYSIKLRASFDDLIVAVTSGLEPTPYIKEFPMIVKGLISCGKNKIYNELRKIYSSQNAHLNSYNFQIDKKVFACLDLDYNLETKPPEQFLQDTQLSMCWEGSTREKFANLRRKPKFAILKANNYFDLFVLPVSIVSVCKYEQKYFVAVGINDVQFNEKFKEIIRFAYYSLCEKTQNQKERTCILDSEILTPEERHEFNVDNTLINQIDSKTQYDFTNIIADCKGLHKLCFISMYQGSLTDISVGTNIICAFKIGIFNNYGEELVGTNPNKVFAEIYSFVSVQST